MTHLEPLNTDELEFIERRYRTESHIYMRTMNVLLVIGALSPLVFCVLRMAISRKPEESLGTYYNMYLVGLVFMMFFIGIIAYLSYRWKVYYYYKDKTERKKKVEVTNIVQKKYMKLNNTFHFYLNSPNKYTIEVSAKDFEKYQLGDEISIEYAQYSQEYFGYY